MKSEIKNNIKENIFSSIIGILIYIILILIVPPMEKSPFLDSILFIIAFLM